jgi:hypothetical protein
LRAGARPGGEEGWEGRRKVFVIWVLYAFEISGREQLPFKWSYHLDATNFIFET